MTFFIIFGGILVLNVFAEELQCFVYMGGTPTLTFFSYGGERMLIFI